MGRGLVFRGQSHPHPNMRGPSAPQFWGSPIYAYTLCQMTTKYDTVIAVGEGRVTWVQPRLAPVPREQSSSALQLLVLGGHPKPYL